jgi:hypothetical protein
MDKRPPASARLLFLPVLLLACAPPAQALVRMNDGKDQINLSGTLSVARDSNVLYAAEGSSDTVISGAARVDYVRRAGMIGVNAHAQVGFQRYNEYTDEDGVNPSFGIELTKATGRTTGSITASIARESRPDAAANIRTKSWEYAAGLEAKYPVIDRYSLTFGTGLGGSDYFKNDELADVASFDVRTDLYYNWSSQHDLIAGYRFRRSLTSADLEGDDHAFTAGITGRILPKVSGTIRLGYQFRDSTLPDGVNESYDGLTASAAATWIVTRRFNVVGRIAKDYSITSTNVNVDGTSGQLDATYTLNAKASVFAGGGIGLRDYLGRDGLGRSDTYASGNAGAAYAFLGDRLKASLTFTYLINWSTDPIADFERRGFELSLSSRW